MDDRLAGRHVERQALGRVLAPHVRGDELGLLERRSDFPD